MSKTFQPGQRVRLPGDAALVTVEMAAATSGGWQLFVEAEPGSYRKIFLSEDQAERVAIVAEDGAAELAVVLVDIGPKRRRGQRCRLRLEGRGPHPLGPETSQLDAEEQAAREPVEAGRLSSVTAALPAVFGLSCTIGEFGRGERICARTIQVIVRIVRGPVQIDVCRATESA